MYNKTLPVFPLLKQFDSFITFAYIKGRNNCKINFCGIYFCSLRPWQFFFSQNEYNASAFDKTIQFLKKKSEIFVPQNLFLEHKHF